MFASHILRIKGDEPLTARSAFLYESFYSEMKNLYKAGTTATAKQILENTILKRNLEKHSCHKPIKYSCPKRRGQENNSLIYTYNENNGHEFYCIKKIENDLYTCTEVGKFQANFNATPEINWSQVGVYEMGPGTNVIKKIKKQDIAGKFIKVLNYYITCPMNVLYEQ